MSVVASYALAVESAEIRYGNVAAVADFSLQIAPGEVHVLLGHSGSGKTTLLRAIAGFERLVAGSVALAGETVDDARRFVPPEHRRIGLVFQDYALFPHMSIARNVAFGMNARDEHAARELLGMVGLAHRAEARPSELSGGEQQRVALARALATRPRLLLLDEPFSNLDPELRASLRDETMRIVRQSGVAAVLVTHSAEEAMSVGDRISVLQRGRRVETARPRDLYFAPHTLVGARALGPLSLVAAQALGRGRIRCALGELSAVHAPDEPGAVGQIAIRPGAIDVSAGNDASAGVRARVDGCRYSGESFELALRLADGAQLEARCPAWGAGVELSSEVGVSVREDAAIWIPDATP